MAQAKHNVKVDPAEVSPYVAKNRERPRRVFIEKF